MFVALWEEQTKLSKSVKEAKIKTLQLTEDAIKNLTDEEINFFLYAKWIIPICTGIEQVMKDTLSTLERTLLALTKKYETSYLDIKTSLSETENTLSEIVKELTGDKYSIYGLSNLFIK